MDWAGHLGVPGGHSARGWRSGVCFYNRPPGGDCALFLQVPSPCCLFLLHPNTRIGAPLGCVTPDCVLLRFIGPIFGMRSSLTFKDTVTLSLPVKALALCAVFPATK